MNHSRSILHMYGSTSLLLLPLLLLLLLQSPISDAQRSNTNAHVSNRRFTPSMAIIVAILISAFFLMAFFSVYLRLCAGDTRRIGSLRRGGARGGTRRAARRGVDRAVIDTFPIFEYSAVKGIKLGSEALECAVCLNEFEEEESLRLLPKCNHVFHPDCIDAWLASHTTCPVCRTELVPADSDTNALPSETPDPATEDETRDEVPLHQVVVDVSDDRDEGVKPDVINPNQISIPIRSKSTRRPLRFPRSHTTGHLLLQPGENVDRFTLRLPEHVRKEIIDGKLDRSVSGGSSHPRIYKIGGEEGEGSGGGRFQWRFARAAKSDRWAFLTSPAFFTRTFSVRSQKRADGEQTANQKGMLPSVKTPFDCLGGKAEAASEQTSARCSNPVFTVSTQ